jgi:hypothetical protein
MFATTQFRMRWKGYHECWIGNTSAFSGKIEENHEKHHDRLQTCEDSKWVHVRRKYREHMKLASGNQPTYRYITANLGALPCRGLESPCRCNISRLNILLTRRIKRVLTKKKCVLT